MSTQNPPPETAHDLEDTVIAVLDSEPEVHDAISRLAETDYEFEVLEGESGRSHLDPAGEAGFMATMKRIIDTFGDQYRILDQLDEALAEGKTVVSVRYDDKPEEAIEILTDHGGSYVWRLGKWTFNRIGDEGH